MYLIFLINRGHVPAKESPLTAGVFIERIIKLPVSCPERNVASIEPYPHRSFPNVQQIVLVMKIPPYGKVYQPQENRQTMPLNPYLINTMYNLQNKMKP